MSDCTVLPFGRSELFLRALTLFLFELFSLELRAGGEQLDESLLSELDEPDPLLLLLEPEPEPELDPDVSVVLVDYVNENKTK